MNHEHPLNINCRNACSAPIKSVYIFRDQFLCDQYVTAIFFSQPIRKPVFQEPETEHDDERRDVAKSKTKKLLAWLPDRRMICLFKWEFVRAKPETTDEDTMSQSKLDCGIGIVTFKWRNMIMWNIASFCTAVDEQIIELISDWTIQINKKS